MSMSSGNGKFSLETFTIDHTSETKTENGNLNFHEPERGIMSVLTLKRIDKTDENLYKCSMTNPFGSDSAFTKLVVQGINLSSSQLNVELKLVIKVCS